LYAVVTVAMYDGVNGIDVARGRGREAGLVPAHGAPRNASRIAAAASAAHAVLIALAPSEMQVVDSAPAVELASASDGDVAAGQQWGRHVGEQVLERRSNDGTQTAVTILAGTGMGVHRASFDARFAAMAPFGVRSIARYRSAPPPTLTGRAYAAAFEDVKTSGQQDGDAERGWPARRTIDRARGRTDPVAPVRGSLRVCIP
jgi:hypothetical protein